MIRSAMTTPHHTRSRTTAHEHAKTSIDDRRPTANLIFPQAAAALTSAVIGARISEITLFLAVMARWLRVGAEREIAARRDWAYSGGW